LAWALTASHLRSPFLDAALKEDARGEGFLGLLGHERHDAKASVCALRPITRCYAGAAVLVFGNRPDLAFCGPGLFPIGWTWARCFWRSRLEGSFGGCWSLMDNPFLSDRGPQVSPSRSFIRLAVGIVDLSGHSAAVCRVRGRTSDPIGDGSHQIPCPVGVSPPSPQICC